MCMALTPSDHSDSRCPKAKWQAGREGGRAGRRRRRRGRLVLYECVKREPLSEFVCLGKSVCVRACVCMYACVCVYVQVSMRTR